MDPIVVAMPVFFILIALEALASWWRGRRLYAWADSLNNLSCGTLQQLVLVFFKVVMGAAYVLVYRHLALFDVKASPWSWLVIMVGVDLLYYCSHRAMHRVGLVWAMHVVHHQSEEYNLT